ncbi:MAG: twin-arginine translocase TatA/TatE family subunit [Myxococcaceae bacterium]|nr:twin-arginine translocase TatA/TatE family subunit [Myxococcaceae bacterium]
MLNIGTGEIIFIAVAALLILGPKKLPEFARTIGKLVRDFRRQTDDVRHTVEREFYKMDQELTQPSAQPELPPVVPQAAPDAIAQGHDHHEGELPAPPALPALPPADDVSSQVLKGASSGEPVALTTEQPDPGPGSVPAAPPTGPEPEKASS